MAGNANRKITLDIDSSGAQAGIDALNKEAKYTYQELQQENSKWFRSQSKNAEAIQKAIDKEKERQEQLIRELRIKVDLETASKMMNATEEERVQILKAQKEELERINELKREAEYRHHEIQDEHDESSPDKKNKKRREFGAVATTAALVAGIPYVGGLLASVISMAKQREVAEKSFTGTTGQEIDSVRGSLLGFSAAEYAQLSRQIAATRGVAGASLAEDTFQQLGVERAMGMQAGQLLGLTEFERQGAGSSAELMARFLTQASKSKLWNVEVVNGELKSTDNAVMGEKMNQLTQLMQGEMQVKESLEDSSSMNILTAFGKLGGGFADQRATSRIQSLDQAIKGGGNEFVDAFIMEQLAKANPDADLLGLQLKRRQGIYGEGNMTAILQGLRAGGMDRRSQMMALDVFTGKQMTEQALSALLGADPRVFQGVSGKGDVTALINSLTAQGEQLTGNIVRMDAGIQNLVGEMGMGIGEGIGDTAVGFLQTAQKIAQDPIGYFTDKIGGAIKDGFNAITFNVFADDEDPSVEVIQKGEKKVLQQGNAVKTQGKSKAPQSGYAVANIDALEKMRQRAD